MLRHRSFALAVVAAFLTLLSGLLAGCGDDGTTSSGPGDAGTVRLVATTSVVADFAREIGGDRVTVENLIKPNIDPHDYEPAPSDIEAIRRAKVVFRNGAGLEAWFDETIRASDTDATVVDASEGVPLRHSTEHENGDHGAADHADSDHGDIDPHIWHDPRNAITMVTNIANALRAADPDGASTYDANLARYAYELRQLDADIETETSTLTNKKLVTDHDAFGYYADRYGFEIVGSVIPSFDSSAEMSAADVDHLVQAIEREGVHAVFAETSLPANAARTIAKEAGVTVVEGEGALYGDGLGPPGSDGATYLDMMRHNTDTIVTNLR
jgi:zinc/manganese transport system substrate-binding protein/manganese/iron transport system substrate-binding protein